MSDIKHRVAEAGDAVTEKAKQVGHKIVDGVEQATEWVKEKIGGGCHEASNAGIAGIKEHMDVIASCGTKVGSVDHVEGPCIKLTRKDSPDGQHHFIPTSWIERVDSHVHLKKNSLEAKAGWKADAASCGCA